ncbi:ABCG24 [Symbiodinium pilosum]|uniref:ABCG24 protein n=1 Tax=Symbiodinium pilosum TaxID=2952 RepID=A0A812S8B4_SYMPI|nr:ABCG24 [Symbiodinium pilosum]
MCAILGPSGAGKTSLMNVLCGKANYAYVSGRVCFNGQEGNYEDYKTVMGFVPQDDIVHEAGTQFQYVLQPKPLAGAGLALRKPCAATPA